MNPKKTIICYWFIALAYFLFHILYLYRNFYYYHADTGWELYSIWAATQGPGHTDFLMSWRAGYLFNVPFMLLGFNLYALRILFLCSWLAAISLLVYGFDRKFIKTEILPAALLIGMICPFFISDFIIDYYTAPPLLLALSIGLLWLGMRQTAKTYERLFLSLGALCLALASLSNIGILPAGILSALLIALYYRNKKASFFAVAYFIALGLLAYAYFDLFGVAKLLSTPVLSEGAKVHLYWYRTLHTEVQDGLFALVLFLIGSVCAVIAHFLLKTCLPEKLVPLSYCILTILASYILLPDHFGFGYALMRYIIYFFFVLSLTYLIFVKNTKTYRASASLLLVLALIFYFAHRTTSYNIFGSILFNYNSLMLISLSVCIFPIESRVYKHLCFIGLILGSAAVNFYANQHPIAGAQTFLNIRYNTELIPALGVKADKETSQLIQAMQTNYYSNDCQTKAFFSFYDVSLPYYLFKREAPFNQSWVSQDHFFPENLTFSSDSVIQMLQQSQHWCVIYSPSGEGDGEPDNQQFLQKAHDYIANHSDKAIPLGYQSVWKKSYTLYIK
ncbi:MAG: hypothetical protein K0R66_1261 [Gammaproteobacteria bacterium]|jgi:hypothetical protein|nr:hypothetical protein [Gammaproteobacteria bacterium]